MRECAVCHSPFEERHRMHRYCGLPCWQAAGGKDLRDVADLDSRHCIHCSTLFAPVNRLQRYCREECFNTAREAAMQLYLLTYIDDVGRLNATKDKCREVALQQGHTDAMFEWWWSEYIYMTVDDRLRLEDLPKL